jgi:hypothetical protein
MYQVQTTGMSGGWINVGYGKGKPHYFKSKKVANTFAKKELGQYGIKVRLKRVGEM